MSKDTRAKRAQRMMRPVTGKPKSLSAQATKQAALAAAREAGARQTRKQDRLRAEAQALLPLSGTPYSEWQAQLSTRAGYERCEHVPNVAAGLSRETRSRIEVCAHCACWRYAPLPAPKAPLVGFAYEGAFCLLPSWLIGFKALKEARGEEAEAA